MKHETQEIQVTLLVPNEWNPQMMQTKEFDLLCENMQEVGFVEPIAVVPVEDGKYKIISGEHRWKAADVLGYETIPCVVLDSEVFDEKTQRIQTVRLNRIRGDLDSRKFTQLVESMMERGELTAENAAYELGFLNESEFELYREAYAESIGDPKIKEEFDRRSRSVNTIDALQELIVELYSKHADTLPANFMLFEYDAKNSFWVKAKDKKTLQALRDGACLVRDSGFTLDSVLKLLLSNPKLPEWLEKNAKKLDELPDDYQDEGLDG